MNRWNLTDAEVERFWTRVNKDTPSGCWEWTGELNGAGYGRFTLWTGKRRRPLAHRLVLELIGSPCPEGLIVMHKCDNRKCLNPDHLATGTYADNTRDMMNKGRQNQDGLKIGWYMSTRPRKSVA